MTNEELNTALYKKLFAEQERYEKWLLTQPPEEILKHSYEFTVRQDILLSLEYHDLTDAQASALLKSSSPLGDIFQEFEERETDYMDTVFDCMVCRADAVIQAEAEKKRILRETPVYPYPADYAQGQGEMEQYRASHKANMACKEAIEEAIREHYHDNRLGEGAALEVIEAFGMERILYVLANTVRQKDWDGRISCDNKAWAKTSYLFEETGGQKQNHNMEFVVDNCNPGLIDIFLNQVRQEQRLQTRPSEEEIQKEAEGILFKLKRQRRPLGPEHAQFMTKISPEFVKRSSDRELDRLLDLLPFESAAIGCVEGLPGFFVSISKDEDRNRTLRVPKPSVREKLQQPGKKSEDQNKKKKIPEQRR